MTRPARHPWRYDTLLLQAAVIWGFAFVAQRLGMQHVGPLTFNGVRFALGAASLLPFMIWSSRRRAGPTAAAVPEIHAALLARIWPRGRTRSTLAGSVLAGLVLFGGATLQQYGVVTTTAGKAGFITGLYVIIVPVLGLLVRQRVPLGTWIGAGVAVVGLYLLSVRADLSIERGDLLCLVGAFFWALHLQVVGWLARRCDPVQIACGQFVVCAVLSLSAALVAETIIWSDLQAATWPILYTGLLSVGVAYTLQAVAQRRVPPAHAAIILSLETVFAVLGGWLVLGETLPPRGLLGCGLMLAGMVLSQLAPHRDRRLGPREPTDEI